jgi:hypothetical protein
MSEPREPQATGLDPVAAVGLQPPDPGSGPGQALIRGVTRGAWPKTQEPAESPAAPLLRYLLAPLEEWLRDPATEELCINKPGEVWVRQRGAFTRHDVPLDLHDCESIAILAGSLRRQEVGPDSGSE